MKYLFFLSLFDQSIFINKHQAMLKYIFLIITLLKALDCCTIKDYF